jgi:hypothetical protein
MDGKKLADAVNLITSAAIGTGGALRRIAEIDAKINEIRLKFPRVPLNDKSELDALKKQTELIETRMQIVERIEAASKAVVPAIEFIHRHHLTERLPVMTTLAMGVAGRVTTDTLGDELAETAQKFAAMLK